jgi:endonuclease VIII
MRPSVGSVIERVDSRGKHVQIGWDDGTVLHTHLRMSGSWHLYRVGEGWRKPINQARVVVLTEAFEAVCFNAPIVETYRAHDYLWHPNLGRLGPHLCDADIDLDDCVARIEQFCEPHRTVAETLLDQRVACGVGNVWKSEALWLGCVHPDTPIGALNDDQRYFLMATAANLLRANLDRVVRVTTEEIGGLAVYGRSNKRCYRCDATIEVTKHGVQTRVTYWCGGCQAYLPTPDAPYPASDVEERPRWFGARPPAVSPTGPSYDDVDDAPVLDGDDELEVDPSIDLYDEPVFDSHPTRVLVPGRLDEHVPQVVDPLLARAAAAQTRSR